VNKIDAEEWRRMRRSAAEYAALQRWEATEVAAAKRQHAVTAVTWLVGLSACCLIWTLVGAVIWQAVQS
jgi:hypothetical protein